MYYDFKSEDNIQEVTLNGIEDLVEDIDWEYNNLRRYETIAIYTSYEEVLMILLKMYKELSVDIISQLKDYIPNEMVVLTLSYDGVLSCQYALDESGMVLLSEAQLTYVYDSVCTYSIAKIIDENEENVLHYTYQKDWS